MMSTAEDKALASVESMIKDVSVIFVECLQEIYKGSYPDITFTIYVTHPKVTHPNNIQSIIHYKVSSDSSGEVGLKNKVKDAQQPVIDCMNNKLLVYKKSQHIFSDIMFKHAGDPINHSLDVFDLDKSQFLETIESSLRNNVYGYYKVKAGQVGKIVLLTILNIAGNITADVLIKLFKCINPNYDEKSIEKFLNEQGSELIEQVKNIIERF